MPPQPQNKTPRYRDGSEACYWNWTAWFLETSGLGSRALLRAFHLLIGNAPRLGAVQAPGEEIIGHLGHGPMEPPGFMIQSADEEPVDAGRIVGSPWHEMRRQRLPLSHFYNVFYRLIAEVPSVLNLKTGQEVAKVIFRAKIFSARFQTIVRRRSAGDRTRTCTCFQTRS